MDHKLIVDRARELFATQRQWRRHLHQNPEISNQEYDTTAFLKRTLRQLGVRTLPIRLKTGVLAEISGRSRGRTVALRSDIDALAIQEQTRLSFKSRRPGVMHACGHDVHAAVLLGSAALLSQLRGSFSGNVRFIFQPAEEMPPGGATPMIENGALKGVSTILGLHVDPDVPVGKIGLRDGATMAAVMDFDLTILGKSGHAARPHDAVDAIAVAAEVVESIQKIVSRELNPIEPVVITFGQICGGTARNIIAESVTLQGTARSLSGLAYKRLPSMIKRTAEAVCRAHGAACRIKVIAGYPGLSNDPAVNLVLRSSYFSLFGKEHIVTTEPTLGAEDFASYLEKVPGAMFRLGVRNKKIHADQPWHSPRFMVDEQALVHGTSLLVAATLQCLESH